MDPPASAICPLCEQLLTSPVIFPGCGHSFCRRCLREAGTTQQSCPLDQTPLNADLMIRNVALNEIIASLLCYCENGPAEGSASAALLDDRVCLLQISLADRVAHNRSCDFARVQCPNSAACPQLLRRDLEQHLRTCKQRSCANKLFGCSYTGTEPEVLTHQAECALSAIRAVVDQLENSLRRTETLLDRRLTGLETRIRSLETTTTQQHAPTLVTISAELQQLRQSVAELSIRDGLTDSMLLTDSATEGSSSMSSQHGFAASHRMETVATLEGHTGPVWGLAVTPEGYVVSGSSDSTVKVWDLTTRKCVHTFEGHDENVHAITAVGQRIFSGSADSKIKVWDLTSKRLLKTLEGHTAIVCRLATDERRLFSGSYKQIRVWNLTTYECEHTIQDPNHWVRAMTVFQGQLFSGTYNSITAYDLETLLPTKLLAAEGGSVYALTAMQRPSGQSLLFAASYNHELYCYDLGTDQLIKRLTGHINSAYSLCVSPKQGLLFSGSYDRTIRVWSTETLESVQVIYSHHASIDALVLVENRGSHCLVSASADRTIQIHTPVK